MPLNASQIITHAVEIARVPGFTSQAGDFLNLTLSSLCQTYDFDITKQTYNFNFNPSQVNASGQAYQNFPANYLRGIRNECFYYISGVPYPMIPFDLEEFDMLVQTAGLSNFPVFFTVDMSLNGMTNSTVVGVPGTTGVPVGLFWMPPSGAYPMTVRYFSQMPDITTPATSSVVPWFPNQEYLIKQVAGLLCQEADDERADALMSGEEERYPQGAGCILRRYLNLKDDKSNRAKQVQLDRRAFGRRWDTLRNTKRVGWVLVPIIISPLVSIISLWVGLPWS